MRCLETLVEAHELSCLSVLRVVRRTLPNGLELQGIDDRMGPALAGLFVSCVHDVRMQEQREMAMLVDETDAGDTAPPTPTPSTDDAVALLDVAVVSLWRCIESSDDSGLTVATRAAAFAALAELISEGIESAVELVDVRSNAQHGCVLSIASGEH